MSYTYENKYCEIDIMKPSNNKDIDAFNYLYDTYAPALYSVILNHTPNVNIAGNILKKSFVNIWRELDGYDGENGRLFTLMLRITLQQCKIEENTSENDLSQSFVNQEHSTHLLEKK